MMKISAHRGYSGLYPENTMLAFQKAADARADEIELDVHLSKDGQVIIFHDESLERLTGQKGFVRDFAFDELRKFNTSHIVYGDKFGFNPIPSLDEYLVWVKNSGIITNIELKNNAYYYEGLEEKTIALIEKYNMTEQVYFSSFNHVSLVKCKNLNRAIPCGVLTNREIKNAGYHIKSNGFDFFHPEIKLLNNETAADCEKYDIGINAYTVNDMSGLLHAQACGCRGLITNYPDICKAWVNQNRENND